MCSSDLDADLSHDPEVLPALIAIAEHGADLCIGSRYVPGGRTVNWPRRRRMLSRWGNRYSAGVLGLAINDATADQITNMVLYYQSTTPSGSTGYFNMTSTNVAVTRTTDKICVVQDATVYPTLYKRVQVQIKNYPFVMMSLFTSGSHNGPNITVGVPVFLDFATTQTTNCG